MLHVPTRSVPSGSSSDAGVAGAVRGMCDENPDADHCPCSGKLFALDVTKPDGSASGVAEALEWRGGVDVVVNKAGSGMFGPIEACAVDDFRQVMEVNYFGLINVNQAALPLMRASKGTLINVASMAAFLAMGGTAPYTESKPAVLGVTEAQIGRAHS